ncbi:Uncharacterised protein [Klebsiella pneumoniae]|uniref:hypothetical protein n=1 Tax=Klebsiella pneumoniae TaxID=573 RepID=UPI000E2AB2FE|nr:hypothetical protein [Klebsiella pneumoniae]SWQ41688.1 Uncharacterised protein [Klebsiella pneumoniae]
MTGFFERKKRAKNAQLTVRLDEQLKKRAELRLEAMGMTATAGCPSRSVSSHLTSSHSAAAPSPSIPPTL